MKCPVCTDTDLLMAERQGVEIDHCPSCRGIWLDRGELDVIVARSNERHAEEREDARDRGRDASPGENRSDHRHGDHDPRTRKRGGFLSDVLGGLGGD